MKALAFAPLLLALALAGCGGSDSSDDAGATLPVTVTQTVTVTQPAEPEVECSTAGLRLTLPEQELPPEVVDVRKRVFDAAVACDYDTLEQIALEKGEGFTFSYGVASDADASDYWRGLEEDPAAEPKPMRALALILAMPYSRNETGSYTWPTSYEESPSEAAWQALVDAGLYTREEIDSMKAGGIYFGYRTAITADGDWQFFVSGD